MNRNEFLSRVREAAQQGRAYRVHVDPGAAEKGYVGACEEDLCAAMATEVDAVGGFAHVVKSDDEARTQLIELLAKYNAQSVLTWQHEVLDRMDLPAVLEEANVTGYDYEKLSQMIEPLAREAMLAADVGITSCDIAVAETGSLIVCSRPGQERVASLITPVHIAIVERRQIVPDLFDAFEQLGRLGFDEIPSNISIVTGPSKTGDIELTLTTGVHGPGKWHVIIIQ